LLPELWDLVLAPGLVLVLALVVPRSRKSTLLPAQPPMVSKETSS
jgi:hypothetical protein